MHTSKNNKGFTVVETLLALILVAIVAFTGYYIYNSQKNKDNETESVSQSETQKTTPKNSQADLQDAVSQANTVYSAWEKTVTEGQNLTDNSQWAQNNVIAAQDLLFVNSNKSWFSDNFISKAEAVKSSNSIPVGGGFLACVNSIAYYSNNSVKASGISVNGNVAKVKVTYSTGADGGGSADKQTHTVSATLKKQNGSWVIDSLDLTKC